MIFPYNSSGLAIPSVVSNNYSSPLLAIAVYNNSPVSWQVSEQPGGAVLGLVPPFYSLSIPMVQNNPYTLSAVSGSPVATSSLTVFAYDVTETSPPLPFANPYGPNSWGSGSSPTPGVLAGVAPADQVQAWQIQQLIDIFVSGATLVGASAQRLSNLVMFAPARQASHFRTGTGTDAVPVAENLAGIIPASSTGVLMMIAFFSTGGAPTAGDQVVIYYDAPGTNAEAAVGVNSAPVASGSNQTTLVPCAGSTIYTRAIASAGWTWQITLRILGYVELA